MDIAGAAFNIIVHHLSIKAIAQWDYEIANHDLEKRAKGCSFVLKHFTFDHPNFDHLDDFASLGGDWPEPTALVTAQTIPCCSASRIG